MWIKENPQAFSDDAQLLKELLEFVFSPESLHGGPITTFRFWALSGTVHRQVIYLIIIFSLFLQLLSTSKLVSLVELMKSSLGTKVSETRDNSTHFIGPKYGK